MSAFNIFIVLLIFIVGIGIVNEKFFKIQSDIALVMFSLIMTMVLMVISHVFHIDAIRSSISRFGEFGFAEYLMDGVLCFMLFAGASNVNMGKFKENVRAISLLALLTTLLSAFFFGVLFFIISYIFGIGMDLPTCILLGCVVSPTDPIAATGILSKIGLSKNVCSVIENESLFNDGTGVALFIFMKSIVQRSGEQGFFLIMFREIAGAFVVALVVSFLLFKLMEITRDPIKYILISLLDVSIVYLICEHLGFSGVIASVVCGMYFSRRFSKMERRAMVVDPRGFYKDFWEIMETLLNSVLFVMIGVMVFTVDVSSYAAIIIPAAIIIVVLVRAFGVMVSTLINGEKNIPGNYDLFEYVTLMTWTALKGGLSLALAISTEEFLPPDIYDVFINVTYAIIFFTVLVQGLSVKKVYFALEKHRLDRSKGRRAH
ncbi:MAG: sodium:proton antiporter [Lachnospiraceae bacterium]|nr:sodium:proton antiporter [Lachnospiraceae bacterium]